MWLSCKVKPGRCIVHGLSVYPDYRRRNTHTCLSPRSETIIKTKQLYRMGVPDPTWSLVHFGPHVREEPNPVDRLGLQYYSDSTSLPIPTTSGPPGQVTHKRSQPPVPSVRQRLRPPSVLHHFYTVNELHDLLESLVTKIVKTLVGFYDRPQPSLPVWQSDSDHEKPLGPDGVSTLRSNFVYNDKTPNR